MKEFKPNFERIAYAKHWREYHINRSLESWVRIENGEIPYKIIDNSGIKDLIKEYKLELFQNDLFYFAYGILNANINWKNIEEQASLEKGKEDEMFHALRFLFSFKANEIKLDLKHKSLNISASITNPLLIEFIHKSLTNELISNNHIYQKKLVDPENPEEYAEFKRYISSKISEYKKKDIKKGRKTKHKSTGSKIDSLQRYLQEYTELKAEQNIVISRKQSLFIYKFLYLLDVFPESLTWEEDNIRHILTKFRVSRDNHPARSTGQPLKEYEIYERKMTIKERSKEQE